MEVEKVLRIYNQLITFGSYPDEQEGKEALIVGKKAIATLAFSKTHRLDDLDLAILLGVERRKSGQPKV